MAMTVATSANATTSGTSLTITKPTGLAEGDLLIALISTVVNGGGGSSVATKSGWASSADATSTDGGVKIQHRIATSGDVSASDFEFTETFSATATMTGSLLRVTGNRPSGFAGTAEGDANNSASSATINFTGTTTPAADDSLIAMILFGLKTSSGAATIGSYVSSPSITFTEVFDSYTNEGDSDPITGIAWGTLASAAEITQYGATMSASKAQHVGAIASFYPIVDTTGTNVLLQVSPTQFAQTGRADTNATASFIEVSPTMFSQSGSGEAPTTWTDETRGLTTWTDESKL